MKVFYYIFLVLFLSIGCVQDSDSKPKAEESSATDPAQVTIESPVPPKVKRGQPVFYSRNEYDPEQFINQTDPGKVDLWFKFPDDDHWFIDWDAERQPFDTIVIHHSATTTDITTQSISASQKERLYAPRYGSGNNDPYVKGLPPHSGHVVNGTETFIGYHHLIYPNGEVTTELSPLIEIDGTWFVDMVGWHTGNWEVNCHSIGVCLIGDFTEKKPSDSQLNATTSLIAHYMEFNPELKVEPHKSFSNTECPGKTWGAWRQRLTR